MLGPEKKDLDPLLSTFTVTVDTEEKSTKLKSRLKWIIISLFTLLWHLGVLSVKPPIRPSVPPPPVEVQQIDPAKLAAIKDQWKQRQLLLSKDQSPPDPNVPEPKDARYDSDRNRNVKREQRARETNVVPERQKSNQSSQSQKPPLPRISDLGNLGNLEAPRRPPQTDPRQVQQSGEDARNSEQALLEDSLPIGAENMLNTRESIYYSFYARIQNAIGPLWQSKIQSLAGQIRVAMGDYIAQTEVVLDQDGNFVEAKILRSSGVRSFDHAIEESWRKIPRFPNPPRELLDSNGLLRMSWGFVVRIDQNSGFQYVPPERDNRN